mmetsp:Transcript_54135/g.131378  ORF Transcript_54135/g.131378 Transcript_54135/m.131378 type:complete len:237 (-) Transcript_54135:948-1658(-)
MKLCCSSQEQTRPLLHRPQPQPRRRQLFHPIHHQVFQVIHRVTFRHRCRPGHHPSRKNRQNFLHCRKNHRNSPPCQQNQVKSLPSHKNPVSHLNRPKFHQNRVNHRHHQHSLRNLRLVRIPPQVPLNHRHRHPRVHQVLLLPANHQLRHQQVRLANHRLHHQPVHPAHHPSNRLYRHRRQVTKKLVDVWMSLTSSRNQTKKKRTPTKPHNLRSSSPLPKNRWPFKNVKMKSMKFSI